MPPLYQNRRFFPRKIPRIPFWITDHRQALLSCPLYKKYCKAFCVLQRISDIFPQKPPPNKKVRKREPTHRKTQTPIAAKQTLTEIGILNITILLKVEFAFLPNSHEECDRKKGIVFLFE